MLNDTEKRLDALFDQMNNNEVSDDVSQSMLKLAQGRSGRDCIALCLSHIYLFLFPALQNRDYQGAHSVQVGLVTTKYGECGAWLVGVKRLIDHAQQTM